MKVEKDKVTVKLFGGVTGIEPDDYPPGPGPKGSVLLIPTQEKPEPPVMGKEVPIVAPFISEHITTSGRPLRSSKDAHGNCVYEGDLKKLVIPDNPPTRLKKRHPLFRAWVIGLWEGGNEFSCGVYHPSGVCLMRWDGEVPGTNGQIYPFCHVCRYIIVDAIDPTQHAAIDADYSYPERDT